MDRIFQVVSDKHHFCFHLVRAVVFPAVMYGCENWTVKKAECRRIDAFDVGGDS